MRQSHRERLAQRCKQRNLTLAPAALDKLDRYVQLLLQWHRYLQLTGLRDAERLVDVLIVESLDFLQPELLPAAARVLDLGTGAGIPGIPLAICAPHVQVTLLDRSEKKVVFLQRVVSVLSLTNCHPCRGQAEELARRLPAWQRFEVVMARGVGSVAHLLRLAAPLLRPGGKLVLRKPAGTPELQEAAPLLASPRWQGMTTRLLPPGDGPAWVLVVVTRAAT